MEFLRPNNAVSEAVIVQHHAEGMQKGNKSCVSSLAGKNSK